jgi:hypothetical protein
MSENTVDDAEHGTAELVLGDDVTMQPEPVTVDFDKVVKLIAERYARENAEIVVQSVLVKEENAALRMRNSVLRVALRDAGVDPPA